MVVKKLVVASLLVGCALCITGSVQASDSNSMSSTVSFNLSEPGFHGVTSAVRQDRHLQIVPSGVGRKQQHVMTPRFCAAIASVECIGSPDMKVKVHPEPTQWRFEWNTVFPEDGELLVKFDTAPFLLSEQQSIKPASDGSIFLSACEARTGGDKLRFEPQPYKNTVGFWTNEADTAMWECHVDVSGWYSVALLQGCGEGQGGSEGRISFVKDGQECDAIDCAVEETGHFQNLRWVNSGYVYLEIMGNYTVTIQPSSIKQKAFGDIRAVSIVQQQKGIAEGNQ